MPDIAGVRLATANTGLKYAGRPDLLLCLLDPGTAMAGVVTRSRTRSAAVDWCAANLVRGRARALVVNAGNANAFTGKKGIEAVEATAKAAATSIGAPPQEVFIASTGVIGEALDTAPITSRLDAMAAQAISTHWQAAAEAIMTTDTFAKMATATARLDGHTVTINGIAKGSGMIAPDMATMLVFLFTDAALPRRILRSLLKRSVEQSYNCITVDGDTSTSDTVLLAATGTAPARLANLRGANDPRLKDFTRALNALNVDLARQVVCDGEGAEKFITIAVSGAENDRAARRIGLSIANSPLVKTAIAGEDANWGRIVMAVGKSGERAERDQLAIHIGNVRVAHKGQADPRYREADLMGHMRGRYIDIAVDVGVAGGQATVWTCDLTRRYIEINADYRS